MASALTAKDVKEFKTNRLNIVTFNYDRSIDRFLHNFVCRRFGVAPANAWNILQETIEIIHLHGILAPYPQYPYSEGDHWSLAVNHIKVVHEMENASELPDFIRASTLLEEANIVHVIGFSMGERNINNLPFFKKKIPTSKAIGINCAIGKLSAREYDDMRHRLRECTFLGIDNLHQVNANEFYERFGFR